MNFFIFAIFCSIAALALAQEDTLQPGGQLEGYNGVQSPNRQFYLRIWEDGDLTLMDLPNKNFVWSSETRGSGATKAIMQEDGQFVLQTASGTIVWSTYTRDAGSVVKVQDDGNFVVLSPKGYPVWNAATGYGKKTAV
jgi:hypothetical protein